MAAQLLATTPAGAGLAFTFRPRVNRPCVDPHLRNCGGIVPRMTVESEHARTSVRVTVELRTDEHSRLRRLCDTYAEQLGVSRVAGAEVFRALLNHLLVDQELGSAIAADLARTGGSRRHA